MFQSNLTTSQWAATWRAPLSYFQKLERFSCRSGPSRAEITFLLSASLAVACGGRGADSMQQLPSQPAGSVTNSESSASPASSSSAVGAASNDRTRREATATEPESATGSSSPDDCSEDAADYIIKGASEACSTRELPECPGGSRSFVNACGCGCSSVPSVPRECRTDCTRTGFCEAASFEDFPDLSDTRSAWQEDLQTSLEFSDGGWLIEGSCAGDRRFLARSNHFFWQANVFTTAGAFLALGTQSDSIDETCGGSSYYPEPVRCADAAITRVLAQDSLSHLEAGDLITLPSSR